MKYRITIKTTQFTSDVQAVFGNSKSQLQLEHILTVDMY